MFGDCAECGATADLTDSDGHGTHGGEGRGGCGGGHPAVCSCPATAVGATHPAGCPVVGTGARHASMRPPAPLPNSNAADRRAPPPAVCLLAPPVAGIIAAAQDTRLGVAGVAPRVRAMVLKVRTAEPPPPHRPSGRAWCFPQPSPHHRRRQPRLRSATAGQAPSTPLPSCVQSITHCETERTSYLPHLGARTRQRSAPSARPHPGMGTRCRRRRMHARSRLCRVQACCSLQQQVGQSCVTGATAATACPRSSQTSGANHALHAPLSHPPQHMLPRTHASAHAYTVAPRAPPRRSQAMTALISTCCPASATPTPPALRAWSTPTSSASGRRAPMTCARRSVTTAGRQLRSQRLAPSAAHGPVRVS